MYTIVADFDYNSKTNQTFTVMNPVKRKSERYAKMLIERGGALNVTVLNPQGEVIFSR